MSVSQRKDAIVFRPWLIGTSNAFASGMGGDILIFIMDIERISFYESMKLLAGRNGLSMASRE